MKKERGGGEWVMEKGGCSGDVFKGVGRLESGGLP